MSDCGIVFFRDIATLTNLRTSIMSTNGIKSTPEAFGVICTNFGRLRRWEVSNADKLTNAGGVMLNRHIKLELLSIRGAPNITDLIPGGDVITSALMTPQISGIDTGVALANHAVRHPCLENSFRTLTDDLLKSILGYEPHLRKLRLPCCPQVTDRSLKALGNLCPQLQWLCVKRCWGTSRRAWSYIRGTT